MVLPSHCWGCWLGSTGWAGPRRGTHGSLLGVMEPVMVFHVTDGHNVPEEPGQPDAFPQDGDGGALG